MTLGEKIRTIRKQKSITQSAICSDRFTRSMLSQIESGKTYPSLANLQYIADVLGVPASFLLDTSDDLLAFQKPQWMPKIREAFRENRFLDSLFYCDRLGFSDDEIALIRAFSAFGAAKAYLRSGSLKTALSYFEKAGEYAKETIYDTTAVTKYLTVYEAVCKNPEAPLLLTDEAEFRSESLFSSDLEFAMYVFRDQTYGFRTPFYSDHLKGKALIRAKRYEDAIRHFLCMIEEKSEGTDNAFFLFSLYADLEVCYREICDFENAYRYASKRISLLEGFKS